jgi:hypothetical protein
LINAPFSMTSTPGYQVAALALTDIEARTVHPDFGERDIEVLEPMLFEPLASVLALGQRVANRIKSDPVSVRLTHRSELICQL